MRLLVSVRSADEVAAALAGGADIIDAKEPAHGSLGAVSSGVLLAIADRTPVSVALSVALGDCSREAAVPAAVRAAWVPPRGTPPYLKLGFAGVASLERIATLLRAAVAAAGESGAAGRIVAVAYADHLDAGTLPADDVLRAAAAAGASGLLVDTWRKDQGGLLEHLPHEHLAALSRRARGAGLLFAVAGSLDLPAVSRLAAIADVVGVRGAACRGGRMGAVDAGRVARLRRSLARETVPATLG